MSYDDLRADLPGKVNQLSKLAQMDMQESQLEQDFSKLAYMFVADKAAQLMRYLLGFEVVSHEPDGSKAVGIFGFSVGDNYYYIPAFFITNQVRGVDLIFSKRTNMFVPLTEEWVDDIVQRDAIELGSAERVSGVRKDFENPNLDFIRNPRIGQSYSSKAAEYSEHEEGKSLFKAAWDAMCRTTAEKLHSDPEMREALAGFVAASKGEPVAKTAESNELARWLSEKGGPASVSSLFDALCSNVKFANAALTVHSGVEELYVNKFKASAYGCKRAEEPELKIKGTVSSDTSDADRQRLLVSGFYIDDKRDPQTLSQTYDLDYSEQFEVVDAPGKYKVLTSDGAVEECWVLKTPSIPGAADRGNLVVTMPTAKLKERGCTVSDTVYARGGKVADVSGLYDTAKPLSQMKVDYTYALIDPSGNCCVPSFVPRSVVYTPGENDKLDGELYAPDVRFEFDKDPGDFDIYKHDRYRDRAGHISRLSAHKRGITLTKGVGKAVQAGDRVIVPSNYRAVLLSVSWEDRDKSTSPERTPSICLGSPLDVKFAMEKASCHSLAVIKDGPEFYVGIQGFGVSRPYSYKQACQSLNGRLGLSVRDTEALLNKAAEDGEARTYIHLGKAAQFVGAPMPTPPEEQGSVDPYTGTPLYGPYEAEVTAPLVGAPPVPRGNPYGENLGGEGETQQMAGGESALPINQEDIDLAARAGEVGQRHVFDYSSIGGLAKVYDTGALIDTYIPQFMQAVDRLGRVLFLYYWKNEDFGERYGSSETIELEDTLRSVFKQFGNLALTLRQKTIESD